MAKVTNQSIPATDSYYSVAGEAVFFGEQYRSSLKPSTTKKGFPPSKGYVSKTLKGRRPPTRQKRIKGLWYDPTFLPYPFNPDTIPDVQLNSNLGNRTTWRVLFRKIANLWNSLSRPEKQCWFQMAQDEGDKCSYYDFFQRHQLNYWKQNGALDLTTCSPCPSPEIEYTTQSMQTLQQQTLSLIPGALGPFKWDIIEGAGQISAVSGPSIVYTAPGSNPGCAYNPTIQVTDACGRRVTLKLAVSAYNPRFAYARPNLERCGVTRTLDLCACMCGYNAYDCYDLPTGYYAHYWCAGAEYWCLPQQAGGPCFFPPNCVDPLDLRTQGMKDLGCCPAGTLELD